MDVVFIGSVPSRLSDSCSCGSNKGQKVHPVLKLWWCQAQLQLEERRNKKGLMLSSKGQASNGGIGMLPCVALNGDRLKKGQRCVSTSNRNFEGRQGGGRTYLASPTTAAASAITGRISDRLSWPTDARDE